MALLFVFGAGALWAALLLYMFWLRLSLKNCSFREQVLESSLRSRDQMVASVSHELKNPLTILATSIALIENVIERTPENQPALRLFKNMKPAIQAMNSLLADLGDVTCLDTGSFRIELQSCDLFAMLNEVSDSFEPAAQLKTLRRATQLEPSCRVALCDPVRTRQILSNLLSNAIKFCDSGGLVRTSVRKTGALIEVSVFNTGKEISTEHLPHVFNRFWRAPGSNTSGSGLGLAIAKGLVELQGGKILAQSEAAVGNTFTFTLQSPK